MDPCLLPPSLRGAIQFPGWAGGGEWHGAAFDPLTGLYYVPSASGPIVVQLTEADPSESKSDIQTRWCSICKRSSRITTYKATLWSNNSYRHE